MTIQEFHAQVAKRLAHLNIECTASTFATESDLRLGTMTWSVRVGGLLEDNHRITGDEPQTVLAELDQYIADSLSGPTISELEELYHAD